MRNWRRLARKWATRVVCLVAIAGIIVPFASLWPAQALETMIGDGLVFYGEAGNTDPRHRTYQAQSNNFSSELATFAGDVPLVSDIQTSPIKQEALAGYITSSGLLIVVCYNGTSWSNEMIVTVGGTGTQARFDITYETTSGDAMLVYSSNAAGTNELNYRTKPGSLGCGGANWSAATAIDAVRTSGTVLWVRAEASLAAGSDVLAVAWSDSNSDLSAKRWDGTAWGAEPAAALDTDLERVSAAGDTLVFDLAFENITSNFMIVWSQFDTVLCTAGTNCMEYVRYTTAWGAVTAMPTIADEATTIDASSNPATNEIVVAAIGNRESDLSIAYWSGSAWTGRANVDISATTPAAGQKLVAVGWLLTGAQTNSIVTYADATATTTSLSYYSGSGSTFTAQSDVTNSPVPGAYRWFDIQNDPQNPDHLMLTFSDANNDLFAKRLVTNSGGTFTWSSAATSALEANLPQAVPSPFAFAYWRFIPPPPEEFSDGQIMYGEGTVATPRNRVFSGYTGGWTAERSLPTAGAALQSTNIEASPVRDEMMAAVVNASGLLTVYRWNGSAWSSEWTATVGASYTMRVSVAYEEISGDAMVAYSTNSGTNQLAYRIWNGTSWTGATNYATQRTSGIVHYVVAKARPGTDEIGLAWGDANRDLSAMFWDGSAWSAEPVTALETDLAQINGAISAIHSPVFDIAFESLSGRMMVGWGENTLANFRYAIRSAGSGGTWGSVVSPSGFISQASMMRLAHRPGSDDIAFATSTNYDAVTATGSQNVQAAYWYGTGWTVSGAYPMGGTGALEGEFDIGLDWVQLQSVVRAIVVVDQASSSGIDYFYYDKSSNSFSSIANFSGSPAPASTNDREIKVIRDPANKHRARVLIADGLNDLIVKDVRLSGLAIAWDSLDPAGTSMEVNLSAPAQAKGWLADYAYKRYFTGGTLETDIVNSDDDSVAAPSLNFSAISVAPYCQETNATLGVTDQKIRVSNSTLSPGWSLSMAATSGSTANWSSGTATYDFNDNGGLVGCTDSGVDIDSLAGLLLVDPSSSTITPEYLCSANGITPGTLSYFLEGTISNITLATASASAQTLCYWDITGISLTQRIPAFQPAGNYSINMTMTVVAN